MTRYALLLCYGIFNHAKVPKEKYMDYLKSFAAYVNQNKIDTIIISGGHTSIKRLWLSEAQSVERHLKPLLKGNFNIVLENWSLTTLDNIEFSMKLIDLKDSTVTIFCDNIRPQKVMWLVLHYWFGLSRKSIERYFMINAIKYYATHFTDVGWGKEMGKGFKYKNVTIKPYKMRTDIDDAISALIGDILEISSIYDNSMRSRFTKYVKVMLGLSVPKFAKKA